MPASLHDGIFRVSQVMFSSVQPCNDLPSQTHRDDDRKFAWLMIRPLRYLRDGNGKMRRLESSFIHLFAYLVMSSLQTRGIPAMGSATSTSEHIARPPPEENLDYRIPCTVHHAHTSAQRIPKN